MTSLTSTETIVIAITLWVAAIAKLRQRNVGETTSNVFLLSRLRRTKRLIVWYAVALVEGVAAPILVFDPQGARRELAVGATALFACGFLYSAAARRSDTSESCGCFGADRAATWGTAARAGSLAVLALVVAASPPQQVRLSLLVASLLIAAQLLGLALLSFGSLLAMRNAMWLRLRTPRCLTSTHTVYWAIAAARQSNLWSEFAPCFITETAIDHWREGCWRFIVFDVDYESRRASAVFAVRLPPLGRDVRVAIVRDDGTTALSKAERLTPHRAALIRRRVSEVMGVVTT